MWTYRGRLDANEDFENPPGATASSLNGKLDSQFRKPEEKLKDRRAFS